MKPVAPVNPVAVVPLYFVVSKEGTADVASVKPVMAVSLAPVTAVLSAMDTTAVSSSAEDSSSLLLSSSLLESSWKALSTTLSTILQTPWTPPDVSHALNNCSKASPLFFRLRLPPFLDFFLSFLDEDPVFFLDFRLVFLSLFALSFAILFNSRFS